MHHRLTKAGLVSAVACCLAIGIPAITGAAPSAGTAKATQKARTSSAEVLPDRRVTFSISAPQATTVSLDLQNATGPSPAADAVAMTKDAAGLWSVTLGPFEPNLYGYRFNVDGARVADPLNRDVWTGSAGSWSNVFVPGPAADYMDAKRVPHGAWSTVRYFSDLTKTERQMRVYTPPGYNRGTARYPVLYLMHGGGGNDSDWIVNMRANFILDNLFAKRKAKKMIVVMPDGNVTPTFDRTSVVKDLFPRELVGSIVPYVERTYRTARGARNRALAGLSLGGLWTFDTLLQFPGRFAYYGDFSSGWFPDTLADLEANHSDLLRNRAINEGTRLLWITVGPNDIAWQNNIATRALFDRYGIRYQFAQNDGGHVWNTWRENLRDFAPKLFR